MGRFQAETLAARFAGFAAVGELSPTLKAGGAPRGRLRAGREYRCNQIEDKQSKLRFWQCPITHDSILQRHSDIASPKGGSVNHFARWPPVLAPQAPRFMN
jgi:hypothetical protein